MTLPAPLDGLYGLRLALYSEALDAGPLSRSSLLARVARDCRTRGLAYSDAERELGWLVQHHLLQAGARELYSVVEKEAAVEQCGIAKPAPAATSQLRTPVFAPRQMRHGQTTFF